MRHAIRSSILSAAAASALLSPFAPADVLPGFGVSPIFEHLDRPTAIRFAPDGRVFVAEKSGLIKVFSDFLPATPVVFADLRPQVYDQHDRGLLSIEIDPDFPTRPYVYALYTLDAPVGQTPPVYDDLCNASPQLGCLAGARLSRLTGQGDVAVGPELVLLEGWCQQFLSHSIGNVRFGPDGALYVTGGEGASYSTVDYGQFGNPCGDPPNEGGALRAQDLRSTTDPTGLNGAMLRIDPDTGAARPDNPLFGGLIDHDDRHIAFGLRNPFRFAFRPGTSEIWIGDVGWFDWEELNRIADPADGIVENFGWPCYEGAAVHAGFAEIELCQELYADLVGAMPPFFAYGHDDPATPDGCAAEGASIAGVVFYDANQFPAQFSGALFACDSSRGCIWTMPLDGQGDLDPTARYEFASEVGVPVDLALSPDGDLVYVDFVNGRVMRVRYYGDNVPPQPVLIATPISGPTPLSAAFDASGSSDSDGDLPLEFAWDLDGDGEFDDAATAQTEFVYDTAGSLDVRVRVTDSRGAESIAMVRITVGNSPPQPVILSPAESLLWSVGQTVDFSGLATDPEDGTLDPAALRWSLVLYHCDHDSHEHCHEHPLTEFPGVASGAFVAPDHEVPAYLELRLTATDAGGAPGVDQLSAVAAVRLDPRVINLQFLTAPPGLELIIGGSAGAAPIEHEAIVGSAISVRAPLTQVASEPYEFVNWSDGGAADHVIIADELSLVYTAHYRVVCPREVDGDGDVDIADLAILLSNFGRTSGALPGEGDMNDDADVDLEDLAMLLALFGRTC